jgi:hypothetical protein
MVQRDPVRGNLRDERAHRAERAINALSLRFTFQTATRAIERHSLAISPRGSREFYPELDALWYQRAQGMPGTRCAAASRAVEKAHELVTTDHTGYTRHSPRGWF